MHVCSSCVVVNTSDMCVKMCMSVFSKVAMKSQHICITRPSIEANLAQLIVLDALANG